MFKKTNYKELTFYKSTRELIIIIYEITKTFPKEEQGFTGIVNQLRRAGISASSNIAEGSSRKNKEYYHFLSLSLGSLREIENQIRISFDLKYIEEQKYQEILEIIDKSIAKICVYMRVLGKNSFENKNN